PILLYFVVLIPRVQNSLVGIVTKKFSQDLGTEVSIENVRFYPFRKIVVNNFLVRDHQNDSLVYIETLSAPIDSFNIRQKQVYLGMINVTQLKMDLKIDSLGNNYSFIIDSMI